MVFMGYFYCSIIVIFVRLYLKDNIFSYVIIGIILIIIPDVLYSHLYKFMYPYFIAAYLWEKEKIWDKIQKSLSRNIKIWGSISILIIFIVLLLFYSQDSYIYNTGITIWNKNIVNQLLLDFYRWIIGFFGSISVLIVIKILLKWIKTKRLWLPIASIGQNTLGIYIFSNYLFTYVVLRITQKLEPNYLIAVLETLIVLIMSYFFTRLIGKNRITRRLLLGGR
jgi:hypothetical protein